MNHEKAIIPVERVQETIIMLRGHRVIIDADLALLYGVLTKRLNEQVRRNQERFLEDFVFQLTKEEFDILKSQFATSSRWGGRRTLPYAFTEHGALMAASVLNTPTAVAVSVQVVRAFVRLRQLLLSHEELAQRLDELENKYDNHFKVVFEALRQLMEPPEEPRPPIGFGTSE